MQVWSSEQYARAVVASGPYHVDALAIADCAAEEEKQQQHQQTAIAAMHRADMSSQLFVLSAAVGSVSWFTSLQLEAQPLFLVTYACLCFLCMGSSLWQIVAVLDVLFAHKTNLYSTLEGPALSSM